MSRLRTEIIDNRKFCVHSSSLPDGEIKWEMKPYEVINRDGSIKKGVSCPKCHINIEE